MGKTRPIDVALHDLCQPLSTLQCYLELARELNTPKAYQEAINVGLVECARLTVGMNRLREIIRTLSQ